LSAFELPGLNFRNSRFVCYNALMTLEKSQRRWCEFRLWKLWVLLAILGSFIWLNSPYFPWTDFRDALPHAPPAEILGCAIASFFFALARDEKLRASPGDHTGWTIVQVVCALVVGRVLILSLFQGPGHGSYWLF
jgi:hypothetical protein